MEPNHLVVVCCHGIWVGDPTTPDAGARDEEWLIADFQAGETPTYVEHIRAGLQVLKEDPEAVLMFSGGPTRPETRLTEAESYARLAAAHHYFGQLGTTTSSSSSSSSVSVSVSEIEAEARRRVFCEPRALDSYGNVLFSLVAFWRRHGGRWPARLTVVSHGFKRTRLVAGHCGPAALAWPAARLGFVGVDPPAMADGSHVAALAGAARAEDDWQRDPHGTGPELAGKRRRRNPWGVSQDLFDRDEDRRRSGVSTIRVNGQEVLDPDATQPWSSL